MTAEATVVARLTVEAATARHIFDQLGECFDHSAAALSLNEGAGGETAGMTTRPAGGAAGDWQVAIHFHEPPNETAVRALVALAAGAAAANALTFEMLA